MRQCLVHLLQGSNFRHGWKQFFVLTSSMIFVTFILFEYLLPLRSTKQDSADSYQRQSNVGASSRHVIGRMRMSGGRLGNEMFVYAAVLGIAETNNMIPIYPSQRLPQVFNVTKEATQMQPMNVQNTAVTEYSPFKHDLRFNSLRSAYTGDVTIIGFFQSWKYFKTIETRLRSEFTFLSTHSDAATTFLTRVREDKNFTGHTVYVGVHIRRGDMLAGYNIKQGYTVADEEYLERAITYITDAAIERLKHLQNVTSIKQVNAVFIVCSDDRIWSTSHFDSALWRVRQKLNTENDGVNKQGNGVWGLLSRMIFGDNVSATVKQHVDVNYTAVYSPGVSTEQDLAILSQCNHTIMTVGTFGWWAGYLAGGITVYYKNFPAPGSSFDRMFNKLDFFPPEWIGL